MTNIYLTSAAADSGVTAGSGTKWAAGFTPGASATHLNKNSVVGPTAPLQMTDGAAGTDGTVVAFYTPELRAVTIASTITCSVWTRENATANNVAPTIRIERCDSTGAVLSTIVSETTNHGALEMPTTAGGISDTITCSAANVTDTTLSDGDRLRITLWIDDASGQGGTGSMASGGRGEFWVNGPNGSQGQAQLAFAEIVQPLAGPDIQDVQESTRGTTNPQTVTFSGALNGDTIYLLAGGDGGLDSSNAVTAAAASTTSGSTGSWTTESQQLTTGAGAATWLSIWSATVTADGSVTCSVNRTQSGTARTWHLVGVLVKAGTSAGIGDLATKYTSNATEAVSVVADEGSAVVVGWYDWDAGTVGTPTPGGPNVVENSSDSNYTENVLYWLGQAAGTRDYGTTAASGANVRLHALEILAPGSSGPISVDVDPAALSLAGTEVACAGSGTATLGADAAPLALSGVDVDAASGSTSVTVDPAILSLSGVDITAAGTGSGGTTVDVATLTLTGLTPTAAGTGTATADTDPAALTLTGITPGAAGTGSGGTAVDVSILSLSGVEVEASGGGLSVTIDPATLALTGPTPTLTATGSGGVTVDVATLTIVGLTPTVAGSGSAAVIADSATLTLVGATPAAAGSGSSSILADAAILTLEGVETFIAGTEPSVLAGSADTTSAPFASARTATAVVRSSATVDGPAMSTPTVSES